MNNSLKKNITFVFGAHGLHLVQSVLMSLLIPKVLGIEEFGFWQLFIFYTQYGGFLHFGLNDGVYLKVGGMQYGQLDYKSLGFQLRISLLLQVCILIPLGLYGSIGNEEQRVFVIIASCIFVLINNTSNYLGYVLQATNRIKEFSIGKSIDILCFIVLLFIYLFIKADNFRPFIYAYAAGRIIGLSYYISKAKDVVKDIFLSQREKQYWIDLKQNIRVGLILTASNVASMLILGYGRFLVDEVWGIATFGKVSFMIMIVNFFLMFINQVSLVLFPELRRWEKKQVDLFYDKLRRLISYVFPSMLLLFLPICIFVRFWLSDYSDSLYYLIFLLPFCIFDGKMQLMCNTLFKVLGNVKMLLICNLIAVSSSVILISTSIFYLHSLNAVVFSMLIAIAIRSIVAEIVLQKIMGLKSEYAYLLVEIMLVIVFIISNIYFSIYKAFVSYLIFLSIILFVRMLLQKQKVQS